MFPSALRPRREDGFTMIEIVVTVAIIGILAAIAVPVYINRVQDAHVTNLQTDVGQTAIALSEYYQNNNGWPPANTAGTDTTGNQIFTTQIRALTKDSGNSIKAYLYDATVSGDVNADVSDAAIKRMACIEGSNTTKIQDTKRQVWSYYFTPYGAVSSGDPAAKRNTTMRLGACNKTGINVAGNDTVIEKDGLISDSRQGNTGWSAPKVLG